MPTSGQNENGENPGGSVIPDLSTQITCNLHFFVADTTAYGLTGIYKVKIFIYDSNYLTADPRAIFEDDHVDFSGGILNGNKWYVASAQMSLTDYNDIEQFINSGSPIYWKFACYDISGNVVYSSGFCQQVYDDPETPQQ